MTEEQEKSGYMGIGVVAENAILGHEELLHVIRTQPAKVYNERGG